MRHSAVLCGAKLALMPLCYTALGAALGASAPAPFLIFLGSLPASASVYALTLTRGLAPAVVGPLVPVSMALAAALALLPLTPVAAVGGASAAAILRVAIGIVAGVCLVADEAARGVVARRKDK